MLREEDIVTALMAYRQGRKGFAINQETMEARSFDLTFWDPEKYSHMIDWGDQKKRGGSCGGAGRGSEKGEKE